MKLHTAEEKKLADHLRSVHPSVIVFEEVGFIEVFCAEKKVAGEIVKPDYRTVSEAIDTVLLTWRTVFSPSWKKKKPGSKLTFIRKSLEW